MIFEKTKAMRNAERYLAQGKIRSAITEYEQVVKHDPKDIGTKNTLGDMYTKNSQIKLAVECYLTVAEHYAKQGFAQKAIAVYNKIAKLEPNRIEISAKLAELYKAKGSLNEARIHYTKLSDHYQNTGQKIEALAVWKQIALLDPKNTEAYLVLAESYLKENQSGEALDAFAEAGIRLAEQGSYGAAIEAFSRAMELKRDDLKVLTGFSNSKFALGAADQAAETLSGILADFPHSREIRCLLIDSLIEANDITEAEKAVVKLVEIEPANYTRFLELARIYLANDDIGSATRILSMSSEHMLVGGQADEFHELVKAVIDKDPNQLEALRLSTRFCSWQKDEEALCVSLARLAEVAKEADSIDDERNALLQLTMIMPHEARYSERLREINTLHGFEQIDTEENLFDKQFFKNGSGGIASQIENSAFMAAADENAFVEAYGENEAEAVMPGDWPDEVQNFEFVTTSGETAAFETEVATGEDSGGGPETASEIGGEYRLHKEVDSIRFYIENGYCELAEKAIRELRGAYGDRAELDGLDAELAAFSAFAANGVSEAGPEVEATEIRDAAKIETLEFDDFRSDLGLEESDLADDSAYDIHYHTAVAYQEMGLLEEAIREFQEAVSMVTANDGTRRFFSCANLLGYCFMQKGMPSLASKWFQRTLETSDLNDDEKQGIWYELAGAYEAEGDSENAGRYFEQVYAENVNFRDVSERVKSIAVNH